MTTKSVEMNPQCSAFSKGFRFKISGEARVDGSEYWAQIGTAISAVPPVSQACTNVARDGAQGWFVLKFSVKLASRLRPRGVYEQIQAAVQAVSDRCGIAVEFEPNETLLDMRANIIMQSDFKEIFGTKMSAPSCFPASQAARVGKTTSFTQWHGYVIYIEGKSDPLVTYNLPPTYQELHKVSFTSNSS